MALNIMGVHRGLTRPRLVKVSPTPILAKRSKSTKRNMTVWLPNATNGGMPFLKMYNAQCNQFKMKVPLVRAPNFQATCPGFKFMMRNSPLIMARREKNAPQNFGLLRITRRPTDTGITCIDAFSIVRRARFAQFLVAGQHSERKSTS
jgi:hypothetical protein